MTRLARLAPIAAATMLVACARAEAEKPREPAPDPAVARAVMAPLLADPDLIGLAAGGSDALQLDSAIPPDDFAPRTVAAARHEARKLLGGARSPALRETGACPGCDALLLDQRAAVLGPDCRGRLEPSLDWSLRLPADLPVIPRAHLREAAGSEDAACRARAASFTAPLPMDEVLTFYRAIAAKAGYALDAAGPRAFVGQRGSQRMAVIVRPGEGGFARVDLLAAG